jgi:hypothetical protein
VILALSSLLNGKSSCRRKRRERKKEDARGEEDVVRWLEMPTNDPMDSGGE